ncbi:hypothetical protein K450DRAFT_251531 [Umbelopsis ramanniana AG]|uniref:BSD domain-containing protein n=1 Tax=Umbelopsis ramanniana AG TaxID=1314678 RepID=A0AAD5E7B6_UMBRA|nr:uncharacterized protein K450DRAFT_251531 [Umbelopsis ramanniana AG]KAI8577586.1 hypothetical protein K450DRAFT_251531 [Umbelopsis ramanniana AG]
MWEPDEQLVLRANTKYKKKDGTLFATSRRVAWQQSGSRQLHPAVPYGDIQVQMQSPATDKNVKLKIVTNPPDPKSFVFMFESSRALAEREAIKAFVSESMARARQLAGDKSATPASVATLTNDSPVSSVASTPAPSTPTTTLTPSNGATPAALSPNLNVSRQEEITNRRQLLSTNKELHTLHSELVINGKNVTEEEFWESPYVQKIRQQMKKDAASKEGQQKGKSSKMVELRPGQQEGSDVKYTLTSQIIHDIFAQYPSVKRAYDANVPDKLSEHNFWRRFLASEFFHRTRTGNRSTNAVADDVFDKCLREEDAENLNAPSLAEYNHFKKTIDLSATAEDHNESGNAPDFTMRPGSKNLPLIRRFNRHAMRVLEVPTRRDAADDKEDDVTSEIIISDLMDEQPFSRTVLDIQDTRRYFESQSRSQDQHPLANGNASSILSSFSEQFSHFEPDLTKQLMTPRAAVNVTGSLTEIIKHKNINQSMDPDLKLPAQVQQKMIDYHSTTNEILRHFWSSFVPYKAEKNRRMVDSLKRQKDKMSEVLITANSFKANLDAVKHALSPVIKAVDTALKSAEKRPPPRK